MLIQRLGIFCNFITGGKVTVEPASAGEEALSGDQTSFSPPTSGGTGFIGAGFIGDDCCFRYCPPASRSLAGGTGPPRRTQKISKKAENDSRRFCLFVYLDLQAAGTDIG